MSELNYIQRLTKYKDGRMEFDVDGNYSCFDDVEWIIKRLEQQNKELINILKSIAKMKENDENELNRITKEIIDTIEKYK